MQTESKYFFPVRQPPVTKSPSEGEGLIVTSK